MAPLYQQPFMMSYDSINRALLNINDPDLVAYLKMNNDVLDSANSNDGTVTGTTTFTTGKLGGSTGAFDFNASTVIGLANESNFDFAETDPFSVHLWVNPDDTTEGVLVSKLNPAASFIGWEVIMLSGGTVRFQLINTASSNELYADSTNSLNTSAWNHVVCTYDGSEATSGFTIYFDNGSETLANETDTLTGSILNNVDVGIGARSDNSGNFEGLIDDVQIWSRELTANEVNFLWNGGSGREL